MKQPFDKKRIVIGVAVLLAIIAGGTYLYVQSEKPSTDTAKFEGRLFSFSYPRVYELREVDSGVVLVGQEEEGNLKPLVGVVRYKSDPESPLPPSFEAFVKKQAQNLCGSDDSIENVTCSAAMVEPYAGAGMSSTSSSTPGLKLSLTLARTNLSTGVIATSTYTPIYVFNVTETPTIDRPLRYQAVFVYPTLEAVRAGTIDADLQDRIMSSLFVPKAVK